MNKSVIIIVATILYVLAADVSADVVINHEARSSKNEGSLFLFDPIKKALGQSAVPPLLPTFLPLVDRKHRIPVALKSAGKAGYSILLATDLPCDGQNNCLYGTLQGAISSFKDEGVPVTLKNGIKAHYMDYECHAYCSEAYIRWEQNGFFYAIGLKGGEKDDLLRVANSVVDYK